MKIKRWLATTFINRNYGLFMLGTAGSGIGYWFFLVAVGWQVLELSDSAFLLGLTNFAQMAPMFFLGLFGGLAADRFERRRLMLAMQLVVVLANAVLAVMSSLGQVSIALILICSLLLGLANSILWPTWSVFIKDLVGPENLRQAVALNSTRFNLTRVIGPALAGLLLRDLGPGWCLWIGFLSSLGIIATIWLMQLPRWTPPPQGPAPLKAVGEGLRLVWRLPPVRRTLAMTGVLGLVAMPFQTFLPAVARDSLRGGPEILGMLTAAVGVGAVVGAIGSGSRLFTARPEVTQLVLSAGVVGGLGLLAMSTTLWPALFALAVLGFASIGYLSMANAGVQLSVPESMVGRVMGLWVVLNAGTQPLGSLVEGVAVEHWGLAVTFGAAAAVCTVAVVTQAIGLILRRSNGASPESSAGPAPG